MPITRSQVKSKTMVAYILQSHDKSNIYLPDIEVLNQRNFEEMLEKHETVYLKPDRGRKSKGIIRIRRTEGLYLLRKSNEELEYKFDSQPSLWSSVRQWTSHTRYVIQQGINSVTKDNRYFDLRCHALRIHGEWVIGGICARLGSPGNIVTTSHIGGTPILLDSLFTDFLGYSKEDQDQVMEILQDCILNAVNVVSPVYPRNWEFAVDIGLDTDKRVWIYEVNNEPLIRGNFKLLTDKKLYEKIRYLRTIAK
ncbi:YheC/YheD family protein [Neobacillus drentensis]